MKFIAAEDDEENLLFQRLVSEDGKIEIAVHPVMFGYRVRAGYVGRGWTEIDWCAGDKHPHVEFLYSVIKNILENKGNFEGVPTHSNIKPYYKDLEFVDAVVKLTVGDLEIIKLKSLLPCRMKALNLLNR